MVAGQSYSVSVTMRNTGANTWTAAQSYRLGSAYPRDNVTWGTNRVDLASGDAIATGQQKTFAFTVRAPSTPGTYYFQWQMVRYGGTWFGARSAIVAVVVIRATDGAAFVTQSVPSAMVAGRSYTVSVTMQNTGTTTWTAAQSYGLGSTTPLNNTTWGMSRAALAGTDRVAPGQRKTFSWAVQAPATPGTYVFQWRMVRGSSTWFGSSSTYVAVRVSSP